MNSHTNLPPFREIFILRIWQNSPKAHCIVEIQNVKTGAVTHLASLEAIAGFIDDQVKSNSSAPEKSQPDSR